MRGTPLAAGRAARASASTLAATGAGPHAATRMNKVWSYELVFDQPEHGLQLKWRPSTTSSHAIARPDRRRNGWRPKMSRAYCRELWRSAARPSYIRSDNGPELEHFGDCQPLAAQRTREARQLIARVVPEWIASHGFQTFYTEPGSTRQNPTTSIR